MNAELVISDFDNVGRNNFYDYEGSVKDISVSIQEFSFIEEKTRPRQRVGSRLGTKRVTRNELVENEKKKVVASLKIFKDLSSLFRMAGMLVFAFSLVQGEYLFALVGLFSTVGFSLFYSQSKQVIGRYSVKS